MCLDISDIIMAPVINPEWLAYLHILIIEHHSLVHRLDPSAIRPKFYFLVHYPELISIYGPPRHYYTMRFESVHQYFKRLTARVRNFVNLTQTLSTRFQNLKAYHLGQKDYFSDDSHVSAGSTQTLSSLCSPLLQSFLKKFPNCSDMQETVFVTNCVNMRGVTYQKGFAYVYKLCNDDIETVTFAQLLAIICYKTVWYAHANILKTNGFYDLLHAYEIEPAENLELIELGAELDHSPLSIYDNDGGQYIPLKYKVTRHVS